MVKHFKISAIALALGFAIISYSDSVNAAKYEVMTSTRAMVARDTLSGIDFSGLANSAPNASTEMYSPDKMNSIIENSRLTEIVRDQDKCQFTADIEDRARLVKSPVFMYAWGQMLLGGIGVTIKVSLLSALLGVIIGAATAALVLTFILLRINEKKGKEEDEEYDDV